MPTHRDLSDEEVREYLAPPEEPVGVDALLQFEGRVNRATFWVTWLGIAAAVMAAGLGAAVFLPDAVNRGNSLTTLIAAVLIFVFAMLFTFLSFANQAKRWHDIGQSAWWTLLTFVPGIGLIVLLVLGLLPGTEGPNKYGSGPLKIRLKPEP